MGKKKTTRDRLLAAAIELMRSEGAAAVTTQRLTEAVGIVQSGFYRHFSSAEDCLVCAAKATAELLLATVEHNSRKHMLAEQDDADQLTAHLESMLNLSRQNWGFIELAITYRYQKTEFGRALATAWRAMERSVVDHFSVVFARWGANLSSDEIERIALSVHAMIMRIGERERNKTTAQRRDAAIQLASLINGICQSAISNH